MFFPCGNKNPQGKGISRLRGGRLLPGIYRGCGGDHVHTRFFIPGMHIKNLSYLCDLWAVVFFLKK